MKKRLFLLILAFFVLFMSGCDLLNGTNNSTEEPVDSLYEVYKLAAANGYEGSYEDWIESIRGENGKSIELVVDNNYLCYRYAGESILVPIYDLNNLKGEKGDTGAQGEKGDKGDKGDTGDAGKGISKIEKVNSTDTADIYRITFTDETYYEFEVPKVSTSTASQNFNVTFKVGEEVYRIEQVEKYANATKPQDPEKEGYKFAGWYIDDEKWSFNGYVVTKDITLVAQWTPIVYTITYHLGDEINNDSNPKTYTILDSISFASPKREGYTFNGWYLENTFDNQKESIELGSIGNIDLYAKWICHVNYTIDNDEVIITSYNTNSNANEVEILDEYEGKPVTILADNVFKDCTNITSIAIPNSVKSIGDNAFGNCKNLNYNIYDNAKYLGNDNNPYLVLVEASSNDIAKCVVNSDAKIICNFAFCNCSSLTSIAIPDSVKSIGNHAFQATSITTLDLNKVETIGDYAFYGCVELKTVDAGDELISTGSYAFAQGSITSIVFPNTFESLGSRAFDMNGGGRKYGNDVQVEFNSEVKFVGGYIFSGVDGLIFMPETDKSDWENGWDFNTRAIEGTCDKVVYTNNGFSYYLTTTSTGSNAIVIGYQHDESILDLVIPATIDNAKIILTVGLYIGGSNVKTITFEDGIEELPSAVLQNWMTLDSLVLPNTLKRIRWNSISDLTINELIIPSSVETIEGAAFINDTINKIYIPSTVAEIGYEGFFQCAGAKIIVDGAIPAEGWAENWYGVSYLMPDMSGFSTYNNFYYSVSEEKITIQGIINSVSSLSIPSNIEGKPVVAVADYAFYGESLTSITIPDSVKSIGNHAFQATSITTLDLNKVETIGDYAFYGCVELKTVDAGDELISTGSYAFAQGSITSIVFPNTFESLGSRAFDMNGGGRKYGNDVQVEFNSEVKFVGGYIFSGVDGLIFMPETDKSDWENGWDFNTRAIEGTCDKVVYTNNGFSYYLTTTSTGSNAIVIGYQHDESILDLVIPATIDNAKIILTVGLYIGGSNVKTITFEDGIEELPSAVLQNWMTLDSLVLPNTLKRIRWNSISDLTINELIIPSSVETIEGAAFINDTINKIYIPSTVAEIGYEGFFQCASSRIYAEASNKPEGWADNWYGTSNINDCWNVSYTEFLTK